MEIERKFLVTRLPEHLEDLEKKEIEQAYLCDDPVIRVRKSNEEYYMTYKSRLGIEKEETTARVCNEVELPLTAPGYEQLKKKSEYQLIRKTRYLLGLPEGRMAELDVFHGYLSGLVFVEVEFPEEEAAENFKKPDWFGKDVTFDPRFSNHYLSHQKEKPDFSDLVE